ncbi:hypothetical protein BH732_07710 [Enterococcus faecium]|nr:hypothetical protein BH732_07710 [Enterococcus faecium]
MNKKMMKFSLLSVSLILTSAGAVTSAIPSMSATYATRSLSAVGVPSAYEEFVSIRNRFKNFAVILYI